MRAYTPFDAGMSLLSRRLVLFLAFIPLLALLSTLQGSLPASPASWPALPDLSAPAAAGAQDVPDGLSGGEWQSMQSQIRAAQYQFTAHAPSGGYAAPNAYHGWDAAFNAAGLLLTPSAARTGETWHWGLRLEAYGTEGALLRPGPVPPLTDKNRITYAWDGDLTEWWINDARGLEQGFTLAARPSTAQPGAPLLFDLALDTSLTPVMDGDAIRFADAAGATVLRYTKLLVLDARGRVVPATMALRGAHTIRLRVEDAGAAYPLTIDPLLISEVATLSASDGAGGDSFGWSVAVSGDTAVVGAPGHSSRKGAAYVFTRNSGGGDAWGEVRKLTASDGTDGDEFGVSVAAAGDTILIGAHNANRWSGVAYLFARNSGGADNWGEVKKLTRAGGTIGDYFGRAVALSGDTAVVGAYGVAFKGAAYVFMRNSGGADNWGLVGTLLASDGATADDFGVSVALSGDTAVVGAWRNDGNKGAAYVYARNNGGADNWGQVKKLVATGGGAGDYLGWSVAVSGDTAVAGAFAADGGKGAAYVFTRNQGGADNWGQVKKLAASDPDASSFGGSVAISGDTAVVGASFDPVSRGAAFVFARNSGGADNWGEEEKLVPAAAPAEGQVGFAVAISGDTILTGAPYTSSSQGAAYIFVIEGDCWLETNQFAASDGVPNDFFGYAVALSGDTAVIGAYQHDGSQGAAYLFTRNRGGADNWGEVRKLTASDGAANDYFGYSVAVSGDTAVIGAYQHNGSQGAAYLFMRNSGGADNWGQAAKLSASGGVPPAQFGYSVAVSGDTAVVGARGADGKGAAYVFTRNSGGADNWGEVRKLTASDGAGPALFGFSVAVSGDTAVIGAPLHNSQQGAAYVFTRNSGGADNWGEDQKLTAADGVSFDHFGWSVAASGDTALVGAPNHSSNKGAAYLFTRNSGGADNWGEDRKLTASDGAQADDFGVSVAISGDTAVVGAWRALINSRGAAYLFTRNNGGADNWGQEGKLANAGGDAYDFFGISVAVSGDTILVGVAGADDVQGAAHLYRRSTCGSLEVTKAVDWAGQTPDQRQTFQICLQGPAYPTGDEPDACRTVDYDGGTLSWPGLQPGDYAVSETDPGAGWSVSISGSPATVASDETAEVTVTNTYTAQEAFIKLIESYAVSRVVEGKLGGEGSKACYWINSSVPLDGEVVIDIAPLGSEVTVDKSQVTLTPANYNNLDLHGPTFVCLRAVDDQIEDSFGNQVCKEGSADRFGAPPINSANEECGDHQDFIEHRIVSSTDSTVTTGTPFMSNNDVADLDSDPATVDALILDDDEAAVLLHESFAVSDLDEDGSPVGKACYWITLATQPVGTVDVTIAGDTEVTAVPALVSFDSSNWNSLDTAGNAFNKVCLFPVDEDDIDQPDPHCRRGSQTLLGQGGNGTQVCGDHLGFAAHSVSGTDGIYNGLSTFISNAQAPDFDNDLSTVDVLIRNDDTAAPVFDPATLNVLEGQTVRYSLSLASRPGAPVQVTAQGAGQAAGRTAVQTQLTFTPTNWNRPQTVTIATQQDNTAEAPQTLRLAHTFSSADANYNQIAAPPLEVTVIDDDTPGVLLSTTAVAVSEGQGGAHYDVVLTSQPTAQVRVDLDLDSRLRASAPHLLFSSANWDQPQRVTITAVDDDVAGEAQSSARIGHSVSSADPAYQGLDVAAIDATVSDNDAAGVRIDAAPLTVSEDGAQQGTVQVVLTSQPTAEVRLSLDGGGQITAVPATLVFTPANWAAAQTVTITAVDDAVDETAVHSAALAAQARSADPFYDGLEPDGPAVSVLDNDRAAVLLSTARLSAAAGSRLSYTLTLASRPAAAVVIDLAGSGGVQASAAGCDDGEGGASCVLFTPERWDRQQQVSVFVLAPGAVTHTVSSADPNYDGLNAAPVSVDAVYLSYVPLSSR